MPKIESPLATVTDTTSPSATVYCLPPVTITAFICFTYFNCVVSLWGRGDFGRTD